MEFIKEEIKVPKQSHEAITALVNLFEVIARESADGFDVTDLSPIMSSAFAVAVEVSDWADINKEWESNKEAVILYFVKSLSEKFESYVT